MYSQMSSTSEPEPLIPMSDGPKEEKGRSSWKAGGSGTIDRLISNYKAGLVVGVRIEIDGHTMETDGTGTSQGCWVVRGRVDWAKAWQLLLYRNQ